MVSKYKFVDYSDYHDLYNKIDSGYFRVINSRFCILGRGLVIRYRRTIKAFSYAIDDSNCCREEFKQQLLTRKTDLYKAIYQEEK